MNSLNGMYLILKDMCNSVESGNKVALKQLNDKFEVIYNPIAISNEFCEYDNCRQPCLMSLDDNSFLTQQEYIDDAKNRLSKLEKELLPQLDYAS